MKAHDLLNAFESLDTELLYAARAEEPKKRRSLGKLPIAAAIVLLLLSTAVLYGIFIAPAATIFLDSRESVTVSLNSRGNVLSAKGYPQLDGEPSAVAVEAITRDMLDSGAINENENTLILGTRKQSEKDRELLLESVKNVFTESRFHGAIISLSCSDTGAKAEVIDRLCGAVDSFTADSLRDLSANDLNLLLHDYEVSEEMELIGSPSEGMYIGKAAAKARAEKLSDLNGGEIAVIYSVYHRRMVYLVTIIRGDRGEAYFINAADGTIENAVKTTAAQRQKTIRTEIGDSQATPAAVPPSDNKSYPISPQMDIPMTESRQMDAPQPTTALIPSLTPATPDPTDVERKGSADPTEGSSVPISDTPFDQPQTITPTESSRTDSLIIDVPYSDLESLNLDYNSEYSRGQSIPVTAITPCWQWRMNFQTATPAITSKQAIKMGEQDKQIALFCTYEDYTNYNVTYLNDNINVGLSDYLTKLRTDCGLDKEFFRENALVMVYYSDFAVYPDEYDILKAIETDGDSAYVKLLRRHRSQNSTNVEIDVYKCVVSATVKKTDIEKIKDLKLIVLLQSEK